MAEHPGIVFKDGPSGRRAGGGLGPDVWEVVTFLRQVEERGDEAIAAAAEVFALPEPSPLHYSPLPAITPTTRPRRSLLPRRLECGAASSGPSCWMKCTPPAWPRSCGGGATM